MNQVYKVKVENLYTVAFIYFLGELFINMIIAYALCEYILISDSGSYGFFVWIWCCLISTYNESSIYQTTYEEVRLDNESRKISFHFVDKRIVTYSLEKDIFKLEKSSKKDYSKVFHIRSNRKEIKFASLSTHIENEYVLGKEIAQILEQEI